MYRLGFNVPGTIIWDGKMMRGGDYANFKKANDYVLESGFDYVETPLGNVMSFSDEQIARGADELCVRSVNGFLPKKLYSHYDELVKYAEKAFQRMKILGVETAVFGSGKMRKIVFNFRRDKKMNVLSDYLKTIGDLAQKAGVTITIEPLNTSETNVFNTVTETAEFVRNLNHPAVWALADIFHMAKENEQLAVIEQQKDYIRHLHVSEKNRAFPGQPGAGEEKYIPDFFAIVDKIGYDGKITVEASLKNFATQVPQAAVALKNYSGK